jgi:hypothetical protein
MPYELEFEDVFDGDALDLDRWLPYHLPQWSGELVRTVEQAPDSPMQLMLGIYEFPEDAGRAPPAYPKEFVVDYVRGYRLP